MSDASPVVVKVQRPLYVMEGLPPNWLIYAKGRRQMQMIPETYISLMTRKAMGKDVKAFFNATFSPKTGWVLMDRVDDPGW